MAVINVAAQSINDSLSGDVNKPKVEIKVNKVYDENGNIIRYDSVYTWSYSGGNNGNVDVFTIDPDSLFNSFIPWFDQHADIFSNPFSNKIFNDSTMYLDFFNNDHFFDDWQNELFNFQDEMKHLDSLKQLFFNKFLEEEKKKVKKDKVY
jgi:hypothetical protein